MGTVSKLAQPAAGRGIEHLCKRILEGMPRPLRERLGLACQRLYHHLGYGLLCSQALLLLKARSRRGILRPHRLALMRQGIATPIRLFCE
jgi:hypothetical protein